MMNIKDILPTVIDAIIYFYTYYNLKMFNKEIIIKHPDVLYNELYNTLYTAYVQFNNSEEVYSIELLYEPSPYWRTYNKLSKENNILETLATYVDDLIPYQVMYMNDNVIISLHNDIPFENGIYLKYGWIKNTIDIYR